MEKVITLKSTARMSLVNLIPRKSLHDSTSPNKKKLLEFGQRMTCMIHFNISRKMLSEKRGGEAVKFMIHNDLYQYIKPVTHFDQSRFQ